MTENDINYSKLYWLEKEKVRLMDERLNLITRRIAIDTRIDEINELIEEIWSTPT